MRHRYFHLDPALIQQLLANLDLMRLFNELLLLLQAFCPLRRTGRAED